MGTMRGVHRPGRLHFAAHQAADDFTKTVAAIAHGQQVQGIAAARFAPAGRDGFGRRARGERALEFIRDNQNLERHNFSDSFAFGFK